MSTAAALDQIFRQLELQINDHLADEFETCLDAIVQKHRQSPEIIVLIKMARALIQYIQNKKEGVHPETLGMLKKIVKGLVFIESMSIPDQGQIDKNVSMLVEEYKVFQVKVQSKTIFTPEDMETLKAAILAIDWEISDRTVEQLETTANELLVKIKDQKLLYPMLKMIHSIGVFIGSQKAKAPSDSLALLRNVFEDFQSLVNDTQLTPDDKKKILQSNLNKFQEFKTKLTKTREPSVEAGASSMDSMPPALSHLGRSGSVSDDLPLTELSEDESSREIPGSASGEPEPALSSLNPANGAGMDVMDDLFSVKKSPADELLDDIHLMEVQGAKSADQAMKMMDARDDEQQQLDGVKKFVPQKKDITPIDEIGSRLDAFFNLESDTEDRQVESVPEEETAEPDFVFEEEETEDTIVPFEDENDTGPEELIDIHEPEEDGDTTPYKLAAQLEKIIDSNLWQENPEQLAQALDLTEALIPVLPPGSLASTIGQILRKVMNQLSEENSENHTGIEESDAVEDEPKGFWRKFKSIFSK